MDEQRAEFEAWLLRRQGPTGDTPGYPGSVPFYHDQEAAAWEGWQAARAQPAQAGQVLTDDQWQLIADITESFLTRDMKNEIEAVLAKRVPMTDDTALIRQLAAALDRCRFDSLNMSVADMRALSEARTAASISLSVDVSAFIPKQEIKRDR